MVVPLLSGGGMRAKILEGMAVGKVVLSTTLGMEGIAAKDGDDCLLADTPQAFLAAIEWCYQQGAQLQRMGAAAKNFCTEHYDNLEIARNLLEIYAHQVELHTAECG
jgi:glycosyltransferase involved in cell wall biosynthesis